MALQSDRLVMVGLGLEEGAQPDPDLLPRLVPGVHLRWAFARDLGFPLHGFVLLRRPHVPDRGQLFLMSDGLPAFSPPASTTISTSGGPITVEADQPVQLVDEFHLEPSQGVLDARTPDGLEEIDLRPLGSLRVTLPAPANHVEVGLGFFGAERIEVIARQWGNPVAREHAGPDRPTVTLRHDAITSVDIEGGAAVLGELRFRLVEDSADEDWEIAPGFPLPLRLPVRHSDYPGTGPENLAASRQQALSRVRYEPPSTFEASGEVVENGGSVDVSEGSLVVRGTNTRWTGELAGGVFQADGDDSGYLITDVASGERLVLSRPYEGTSRSAVPYTVSRDSFGILHDQLVHLVRTPNSPVMSARILPLLVHDAGRVEVQRGSHDVAGTGTSWNQSLEDLTLRLVAHDSGQIDRIEDDGEVTRVFGTGTAWESSVEGLLIRFADEPTFYGIEVLDEQAQSLTLERRYVAVSPGSTQPATGQYAIYESTGYPVDRVTDPTGIELKESYPGPDRADLGYVITGQVVSGTGAQERTRLPLVSPLDMILLGSIHPSVAQMVGLYWVDETAEAARRAHDYFLLADYGGALKPLLEEFGSNREGLEAELPSWLHHNLADPDTALDGYIVFDRTRGQPAPVSQPQEPVCYALPTQPLGGPGSPVRDTRLSAGLCWDPPGEPVRPVVLPDRPVLYHAFRARHPETDVPPPAQPPDSLTYQWISKQRALLPNSRSQLPSGSLQLPGWPEFPLDFVDTHVDEGWYTYRLRSVDIFGRFSPLSAPARWEDWDSPPNELHSSAVRLLDRTPPPPPTGVVAQALDPDDPFVTKDAAYRAWRANHPDVLGLRVAWTWTEMQARQAPDTERFHIHFSAGRSNAVVGQVTEVTPQTRHQCEVILELDQPLQEARAEDEYRGTRLQAGGHGFDVVGSEGASSGAQTLSLTVGVGRAIHAVGTATISGGSRVVGHDTGWHGDLPGLLLHTKADGDVHVISDAPSPTLLELDESTSSSGSGQSYSIHRIPRAGDEATIEIPGPSPTGEDAHPLWMDSSDPENWDPGAWQPNVLPSVDFEESVTRALEVRTSPGGRELVGKVADIDGNAGTATLFLTASRSQQPDLSGVDSRRDHIQLDADPDFEPIAIDSVEAGIGKIALERTPRGVSASAWTIGRPIRRYEVFLEAPASGLQVSEQAPLAYSQIGITALDRRGNESRVAGPAPVYRVHRTPPPPPDLPPLEDEVLLTSAADYHGNSYFSFRWSRPPAHLTTHVLRALDDALFRRDWLIRYTRTNLTRENVPPVREDLFRGLSDSEADAAAAAVRSIDDETSTSDLSDDAWLLLTRLPANEGFISDGDLDDQASSPLTADEVGRLKGELLDHEKSIRRTRKALSTEADSPHDAFFPDEDRWSADEDPQTPPSPSQRRRQQTVEALNALPSTPKYDRSVYRELTGDAQRILANLPGNEGAFTRLTTQAIDSDSPEHRNRAGPDDPADFDQADNPLASDSLLRYEDRLDGRTRSRYFYRASLVDGAQNVSSLGLSTPPVETPNVLPPRRPVVTNVIAGHPDDNVSGDRMITLHWARGSDPDLDHYRVYRSDREENARDIRLMELVDSNIPAGNKRTVQWSDSGVPPQTTFLYRVIAVNSSDAASKPSGIVTGRSFARTPPAPPQWVEIRWMEGPTGEFTAVLSWMAVPENLAVQVQRRPVPGEYWTTLHGPIDNVDGHSEFVDSDADYGTPYEYRLEVHNQVGITNRTYDLGYLPATN